MTENTKSSPGRGRLSRVLVVTAVLLILALLFLGYVAILQPILGNPFVPFRAYEGLEFFAPSVYREFEKGTLFAQQYASYDFLESCDAIDFYYADNKTNDSFLYGKQPDVYALTLNAGTQYDSIAQYIRNTGTYCGEDIAKNGPYVYYLMPSEGVASDRFVFCVGDTCEFLRFILVTEIEDEDLIIKTGSGDIVSEQIIMTTIRRYATLDYETANENGYTNRGG